MVYVKQSWVNNDPTKPLSATRLNKLETQYDEAISQVATDVANDASAIGGALSTKIGAEVEPVKPRTSGARAVGQGELVISVQDYGALGDGSTTANGAMTAGSATLSSAGANFLSTDVGKMIVVAGAGAGGGPLSATIQGRTSTTVVTLSAPAQTSVTGASVVWGTDDTAAIQAAVLAALPRRARLVFPARRSAQAIYCITSAIQMGASSSGSLGWALDLGGSTIMQFANGVPIFLFTKELTYLFAIENGGLQYASQQSSGTAIYFDSDTGNNYGFYNFTLQRLRFSNCFRGIGLNESSPYTIPVWGITAKKLHFTSSCTGSAVRLVQASSGQPNMSFEDIYVRGDAFTETEFVIQGANVVNIKNYESNRSIVGSMLLTTCDAVHIDGWRSEHGTFSSAAGGLIRLSDTRAVLEGLQLQSKTIAVGAGNRCAVIRGIGSGTRFSVENVRLWPVSLTSGNIDLVDGNDVTAITLPRVIFDNGNMPLVNRFDATPTHVIEGRGIAGSIASKTANYTLTAADDIVIMNGANLTATVPGPATSALGTGRQFVLKNIHSTALTVAAASGAIDGASSFSLAQNASSRIVTDGANWYRVD